VNTILAPATHGINLLLTVFLTMLAGCMRTDPASVTQFVKEEITTLFPDAKFEETAEGELGVLHKDGTRQILDLTPVQENCKRVPRSCGSSVSVCLW
jgi:hypothetical protein